MSTRPASSVRSLPSANSSGTKLARPAGFEPTTLGFGGQYSNPLSYGRFSKLKSYRYLTTRPMPDVRRARPRSALVFHQDAAAAHRRGPLVVPDSHHRHHPSRPAGHQQAE